jgi:spore maturation protein CgeB
LSVKNPIVFSPPVSADAEVQSAANLIANRAPDRRNIVGRLFRSPDRRYLLLIEFETAAGANALYFDITNWAKDRTKS